jgi:hypothetical protein
MKKLFIASTLFSVLFLVNCQQKKEEKTINIDSTELAAEIIAGNDLDAHGCKASAGYTWSKAKNDCIRVFESGVRLDVVDSTLDKTLSAFAVFVNDEEENKFSVEIFMPSLKDSTIILNPIKGDGAGTWSNGKYKLSQWKGMYSLEEGNNTIYEGHR